MKGIVQKSFDWTAQGLVRMAAKLGLTYNEVNVLVYYLVVPLTWTVMFDFLIMMPLTTPLLLAVWAVIFWRTRGRFSRWSDWAFKESVRFLNYFNRFGGNYELNSVIICLILPALIYVVLICLLIF